MKKKQILNAYLDLSDTCPEGVVLFPWTTAVRRAQSGCIYHIQAKLSNFQTESHKFDPKLLYTINNMSLYSPSPLAKSPSIV